MSNAGIIVIGLWTLIQSVLYGVVAGLSYAAHHCHLPMTDTRFVHVLYAWYFQNDACGSVNWDLILDNQLPSGHAPTMPPITDVAYRTSIISYIYFATSILWCASSVLLLMAVCCNCGRRSTANVWMVATVIVVLVDLSASSIFIWDITGATSDASFQSHFQVTVPTSEPINVPPPLLALPSIIMLLVSSRILVFWILNIVLIFVVWRLSRRPSSNYRNDLAPIAGFSSTQRSKPGPASMQAFEPEVSRITASIPDQNRPTSPARSQPGAASSRYDDQAPYAMQRRDSPPIYSRTIVPINDTTPQQPARNHNAAEHRYYSPMESNNNSQTYNLDSLSDNSQRITIDRPHLRHTASNRPAVPPKPQKNQQQQQQQQRQSNNHLPSDALRGQLPWSYFPADRTSPKQMVNEYALKHEEDRPTVPEPDYAMHIPRKDRHQSNSSFDDGEVWSGPERRY